ncbi:MAG: dihydroorotase [Chloroflexota bacterium]|nr:dihydroorotase [Chloroflexota bacterium]
MSKGSFGRLTDAPATFVLAGVRVIDPNDGSDTVRDLAVVDGFLAGAADVPRGAERIDAAGLVAAPGFCDLHTHVREPGGEAAETISSATRAAARGGFTTVCAMPNTEPPLDEPARIAWVVERARETPCRVRVIGAVTVGRAGDSLTELGAMADAGAVGFSDDGAAVESPRLARAALSYLRGLGRPLIEHAEDASLASGAVMRAGPTATRLGLAGWSPSAELTIVERDIALAAETGARVHFTHLSTATALEAVRRARGRGLAVTCDVTPHHLAFTDAWVAGSRQFAWEDPDAHPALDPGRAFDGSCRVNPPLPSRDDALALLAGLVDGTIDTVATDHAPHPPERKLVPFAEAAAGMIGLETALSVCLAAVEAGRLELSRLVAALSIRPAEIIGERRSLAAGQPADLVVFDPLARWRVADTDLASASANTPLLGMDLPGVVRLTVADGRITYRA